MFRKLAFATTLSALLTVTALAGDATTTPQNSAAPEPAMDSPVPEAHAGYFFGMNFATYGNDNIGAMIGYVDHSYLVDFGMGYEHIKPVSSSVTSLYEFRGDAGFRRPVRDQLYATYGALGSYGMLGDSTSSTTAPYTIGAFVGLDYQPARNLLLSFKLSPFDYQRDYVKATRMNVFSDGSIGMAYLFD